MGTSLSFRARLVTLVTTRSLQGTPSFFTIKIHPEICESSVKAEPLFPFGHGLSYTGFRYTSLRLSPEKISPDGTLTVSVNLQNIGSRAGDEVVQLYVHDVQCRVTRPGKELRGFQRISLQPDETKTVTFSLPAGKLSFYDESTHRFIVEPGEFDVLVGSSSADIRLTGQFEVTHASR